MPKKFDRKKMKKELLDRTRESYESREDSGRFKNIFSDEVVAERNVLLWECKNGDHIVDFIPYIATELHPRVEDGKPAYNLDIWVHRGIGVNENAYVCPARNYDKSCPICEHLKELDKDEDVDEDVIKALLPKRRCLYNVLVHDEKKERKKGVQVWEIAHYFIEKHLTALAKDPRTNELFAFSDPDEGKTFSFTREGSRQSTDFIGHKFIDRDYIISDKILDQAQCLEELIEIPTYKELYEIYHGTEKEETEEVPSEEETPGEEKEEKEEKPEVEGEEGEDDLLPKKPEKEEKEKKEEKTTKKDKGSKEKCPHDHKFGVDTDKYDECDGCEIWDPCAEAADS